MSKFFVNREWENYWATRAKHGSYLKAFFQIGRVGAERVLRRFKKDTLFPEYLSESCLKINLNEACAPRANPVELVEFAPQLLDWAKNCQQDYDRFLASSLRPIKDPEDYWTLHQFGWLFVQTLAGTVSSEQASHYMNAWVNTLGHAKKDPAWRSYSISERLCNWAYLLQLFDEESSWHKVLPSMEAQTRHLLTHLECPDEQRTNNHFINNGRALCFVGEILGSQELKQTGKTILIHEAKNQFTHDGFLNEGSSHYQLITTKNYLEAFRITQSEELLSSTLIMLKACEFFVDPLALSEWQFPFIGDISPDPSPLLFDRNMRFWQYVLEASTDRLKNSMDSELLLPWFVKRNDTLKPLGAKFTGWLCYPDSGYYRWNSERYCIWWHSRKQGLPRRHAHNDWGSFQLHLQGEPIFIDTGRGSYQDPAESYDGRFTLAHNTLSVGGFEQALFRKRDVFDPSYLIEGADVDWNGNGEFANLSIKFHGYKRLVNPVLHTRIFSLRSQTICIKDIVEGESQYPVTIAFHLHPRIRCKQENKQEFSIVTPQGKSLKLLLAPGGRAEMKRGGNPRLPGGYHSEMYNSMEEIPSIFAHYDGPLPMSIEHTIQIEQ